MRNESAVLTGRVGRPAMHLLCFCLVLSPALAQQAKLLEPELRNVVYLVDSSDHTLKPLPKEPAKITGKLGLAEPKDGFAKAHNVLQIPGPGSSFRLKGGSDLDFVIKCRNIDSLRLYVFTKTDKNRKATASSATASGTIDVSYGLKLYLTEYGESSYKIVVRSPEPGEYGFAKDGFVFDFAVDPK